MLITELEYNATERLEVVTMWVSLLPRLLDIAYKEVTISNTNANKYIGDLRGLFYHVLKIEHDVFVPHMLANGYKSSSEYAGDVKTFKILDSNTIMSLLRLKI